MTWWFEYRYRCLQCGVAFSVGDGTRWDCGVVDRYSV